MIADNSITVFTICNNIHKKRPRHPLVQIICNRRGEDQASICFTPTEARKLVREISIAAKDAASNRRCGREVEIELAPLADLA